MPTQQPIGFIGLGKMGAAFAKNLLAAGHQVTVWNRSPGASEELHQAGAKVARDTHEMAELPVVFTLLADDQALRETLLKNGALRALGRHAIHVCLATISVELAEELTSLHAAAGSRYVSAPIFGRPDAVAAKACNIVAAGETSALDAVEPLLLASSQKVWRVGEKPSQANAVKLGGNFMIACAIEAMAEAFSLARKHGVESKAMLEILTNTMFNAPAYKNYGAMIAAEQYAPAKFLLKHGLKDIRLALKAAEDQAMPMPFASVLRDQFLEAVAKGDGEKDWVGIAGVQFQRAGFSTRT